MRRLALSLALAAALPASVAAAQPTEGLSGSDPREVAARVHEQGNYPGELRFRGSGGGGVRSFPSVGGGGGSSRPDEARRGRVGGGTGGLEGREAGDANAAGGGQGGFTIGRMLAGAGQLLSTVLLVAVIVLLVGLVVILVIAIRPREEKDAPEPRRPRPPARAPTDDDLLPLDLGDADRLAAEGRFADAILALLVEALRDAGWDPRTQRSRTGRESLRALGLTDPRRAPLDQVVRRAERVRFAGEEATHALFLEVREHREAVRRAAGQTAPSLPAGAPA